MKNKFVIFDPPMCCSSGVCGPSPDQALISFQDVLREVNEMGADIQRHLITQSPEKFKENPDVIKLLQEKQLKALPITTCNGKIVKFGSYPTLEEFKNYLKN